LRRVSRLSRLYGTWRPTIRWKRNKSQRSTHQRLSIENKQAKRKFRNNWRSNYLHDFSFFVNPGFSGRSVGSITFFVRPSSVCSSVSYRLLAEKKIRRKKLKIVWTFHRVEVTSVSHFSLRSRSPDVTKQELGISVE